MDVFRIALSVGEPAGIGPDIVLKLIQQPLKNIELVAYCDPELLLSRARTLQLPCICSPIDMSQIPSELPPGHISVHPIPLKTQSAAGTINIDNSSYVIDCLDAAINACITKDCHALVTAPINKAAINNAGILFSGHTEFIADITHRAKVVMMLATKDLRVALVTTHHPLSEVPSLITFDNVKQTIEIVHHDLVTYFGIAKPNILICGLNPHAGEDGHLGHEEINTIMPAITSARQKGINISDPLPADTLFTKKYLDTADVVISMYHDQGLPVLKSQGFGDAVNITLGLPFIRTSVDHGTALEIAGSGTASESSLMVAINTAYSMALHNHG